MVVDYTQSFQSSILAQGKGTDFIYIEKLSSPVKRFDGKRVSFFMEHRWLSSECKTESDQSWACVQGADVTYWSAKELASIGINVNRPITEKYCIFDHVHLM